MASPISAQAAQQKSTEESREEFDTRMLKMVSSLEKKKKEDGDVSFFAKRVFKSMTTEVVQGPFAYSLEFPYQFLVENSKKFDEDVTFTPTKSHQTWPIKITIRPFKHSKPRVFAYGLGGWKAFVMDNHIKVGDFLIFKLITFSHFKVFIGRSPIEVHADDNNNVKQDNGDQELTWPQFVVTIRRPYEPEHPENHFYLEKDLSLVVPSHFWELHSHMLEQDELRLKGPTKTITMVKVERTYHEEVHKVRLMHSGWKAFLLVNNLAIGDVLEFSLIGNSSFRIKVVD